MEQESDRKSCLNFFDLPAELRIRIYWLCAEPLAGSRWFFATDKEIRLVLFALENCVNSEYPRFLMLRGEGIFAKNLLLSNRRVYDEAVVDLYKYVTLQTHGLPWRCFTDLNYWFREHPFHFTQKIEVCSHRPADPFRMHFRMEGRPSVEEVVTALNEMPNLRQLDIFVWYAPWSWKVVENKMLRMSISSDWYQMYFVMANLRAECKYRLLFRPQVPFHPNWPSAWDTHTAMVRYFEERAWEVESQDVWTLHFTLVRPDIEVGDALEQIHSVMEAMRDDEARRSIPYKSAIAEIEEEKSAFQRLRKFVRHRLGLR